MHFQWGWGSTPGSRNWFFWRCRKILQYYHSLWPTKGHRILAGGEGGGGGKKEKKSKKAAGGVPVIVLYTGRVLSPTQRALPRVTVARSPGAYLSKAGQRCALTVTRVNSRSLQYPPALCPLTRCPSQPFSSLLCHSPLSGVSRPVKYINEFLAPALCTQVMHCTPLSFCSWCFQCMVSAN